jgi:hypothetical protein
MEEVLINNSMSSMMPTVSGTRQWAMAFLVGTQQVVQDFSPAHHFLEVHLGLFTETVISLMV